MCSRRNFGRCAWQRVLIISALASFLCDSDAAKDFSIAHGASTDITGLTMEDIVGDIQTSLERATSTLHLSSIPIHEILGMQQELKKAAQGPTKSLPQHWEESGNLATFNGLKLEPYITVPIDLNLVFIGFSGDGHYKLNLHEDELKPWFEHMEHRMAHTMVPLRQEDSTQGRPSQQGRHVYYKYSFHVLELHPDVCALVEAVIWDNARPVDPWSDSAITWTAQDMHQVDPWPVTDLLEDLVSTLRLNSSYTLFLMNPKLPHPDFNYGYRHGFSDPELERLHLNDILLDILLDRNPARPRLQMTEEQKEDVHILHEELERSARLIDRAGSADPAEVAKQREQLDKMVNDMSAQPVAGANPHLVHEAHGGPKGDLHISAKGEKPPPRGRPKYTDMRNLSKVWAAAYKQAMHDLSYWQRHPAEEPADDMDEEAMEAGYIKEMKRRLGTPEEKKLPPDMLFEVLATRLLQSKKSEERQFIRTVIEEKYIKEDCLTDLWIGNGRFAFIDFSAGPFEWGPIVGGKGVVTSRSIPDIVSLQTAATDFTAGGRWKDPAYVNQVHRDLREHGLEKLAMEKELLLAFLAQMCQPTGDQASGDAANTCHELRHKLSTVEAFIKTHTRVETSDEATLAQLSFVTGGPHEGANVSLVQRAMFAKLGALIGTTQRQLITPPVSGLPAPYRSQVFFHVYILSNHNTYKPDAKHNFDYVRFKEAIDAFKLPRQQFHHVLHKYTMAEDHALAVAFANSLRSAAVATLRADGQFVTTKRLYLDSQVLQRHLQLLHEHFVASDAPVAGAADGAAHDEAGAVHKRDVPIFIFSMDVPMPVFIDKHYQARALEDMVVAAQSDEPEWESHLACNGKPVSWNLRDPLRAVLAATAQHLSGLLPMHIGLDEARGRITQDWLWSVGCSPLSHTSALAGNFSRIHVDAAHRAAAVDMLREALELANAGVRDLLATTTSRDNAVLAAAAPNDRLVQLHVAARLSIGKAVTAVRRLDFDGAVPHAHAAVRSARTFRELAAHSRRLLLLSACLHPLHNAPFDYGMVLVVAAAVLAVGGYYVLVPTKTKPKIN